MRKVGISTSPTRTAASGQDTSTSRINKSLEVNVQCNSVAISPGLRKNSHSFPCLSNNSNCVSVKAGKGFESVSRPLQHCSRLHHARWRNQNINVTTMPDGDVPIG